MSGRYLFLIAAMGCSSPSVATKRDVAASADQGSAAAAAAAPRPESRTAPTPPLPATPDEPEEPNALPRPPSAQQPPTRQPYTFDWERVRKAWEEIKATPSEKLLCDPWTGGATRKYVYCKPDVVKGKRAARVTMTRPLGQDRTEVWLDLGVEDLRRKKWYAALIDEQGHPIMEWVHLEGVAMRDSAMIAPIDYYRIDRETARVALVEELPK